MSENLISCKKCGKTFKNEGSLHKHLKMHDMTVAEYYTTYYPRTNKLTKELLPFRNKSEYFNTDFSTRSQMIKWCYLNKGKQEVKDYILKQLSIRVKDKQLKYAPNHLEIEINNLPPIDVYKDNFGGYGQACKELGLKLIYDSGIKQNIFESKPEIEEIQIYIDTREQKPLSFKNSKNHKLDFGDYTIGGSDYTYTYVDRKSESDFKGTLGVGFNRFRNELERARKFNAYLYIVIENSIEKIIKNNQYLKYKSFKGSSNLSYIWHNMRLLTHEFKGHCQFVFSGSREKSEILIPNLLYYGKSLWNVDIQYFLDKNNKINLK